MATAIPEAEAEAETTTDDHQVILHEVDWGQYVTVNDAFPDRRGLRMIYIDGSLTILTLSRRHDWLVDYLDSIVKAVAIGTGVDMDVVGSATLRLEERQSGVEGDRTYYFGANALIMRGPVEIDLTTQPPPDLAIEVELTHPATKAIASYARIGVSEVWRYNVRRETLSFLVLDQDGVYQSVPRSRHLPFPLMPGRRAGPVAARRGTQSILPVVSPAQ